jgi:hypothetical protein
LTGPPRLKRSASDLENERLISVLEQPIERENSYQSLNITSDQDNSSTLTKTTTAAKKPRLQRTTNDSEDDPDDRSYRPGQTTNAQKKKNLTSNKQNKSGRFEIEIDYEDDRSSKQRKLFNNSKFRMKSDNCKL